MRILATLLVLSLLPLTSAQPEFDEDHTVRIAFGDIPTTKSFAEPAGVWNFHHTIKMTGSSFTADVPTGHTLTLLECRCNATRSGDTLTFAEGDVEVSMATSAQAGLSGAGTLSGPDTVILLVLSGAFVTASDPAVFLPGGESVPGYDIYLYENLGSEFWFASAPTGPKFVKPVADEAGFPFLIAGLALLIGMGIWYVLVQQGKVQVRTRKQVAQVAAHVEAAKEPKTVLQARKRVLMAGLKELELAKQSGGVETATYDQLKAELKKETVTVMRAIEEA